MLGYREYQRQLHTITPATRRTLVDDEQSRRGWFVALALLCFGAAVALAVWWVR